MHLGFLKRVGVRSCQRNAESKSVPDVGPMYYRVGASKRLSRLLPPARASRIAKKKLSVVSLFDDVGSAAVVTPLIRLAELVV